jgi:DNA-binding IclR family transcriptional regulator
MKNHSSTASNETEGRRVVPAISKASRVLGVVSRADMALGISEIARATGLNKSTVHGLIAALVEEGFLVATDGTKGYALGPKLLELGIRARDQRLLDVAESELQGLVLRTGETGLFGRLNGNRVVIVARRESSRMLNLSAPVGSSVPAMAGALGKAYVATMDTNESRAYLERTVLPSYTDRSVTDIGTYLQQANKAVGNGYATDRGEYLPGISAAASAFRWLGGTYFVWVVGIDAIYNGVELGQLGEAVRETAQDILQILNEAALQPGSGDRTGRERSMNEKQSPFQRAARPSAGQGRAQ